jgi:polysaccharide deacetylase family protein (PEP-CTERM system associated)
MELNAESLQRASQRPAGSVDAITNALSIDVEDYFQVSAFEARIDRDSWDALPCRVEHNVARVLDLLGELRCQATFFVLGWIAHRYPELIRTIADAGHEIASHGYAHRRATEQAPQDFLDDVRRTKRLLEDIAGCSVIGYRAPSFSICERNLWAFDCLVEAGYRYSSSVYPVYHDHYGMPDAPRFAHRLPNGLIEVPLTTARVFGMNLPAGGGGYFRLAPYRVSRWAIARVNRREQRPAIFYVHPWELDPEQPRVDGVRLSSRLRHYLNLDKTEPRLRRLIGDFRWDRVDRTFGLVH